MSFLYYQGDKIKVQKAGRLYMSPAGVWTGEGHGSIFLVYYLLGFFLTSSSLLHHSIITTNQQIRVGQIFSALIE